MSNKNKTALTALRSRLHTTSSLLTDFDHFFKLKTTSDCYKDAIYAYRWTWERLIGDKTAKTDGFQGPTQSYVLLGKWTFVHHGVSLVPLLHSPGTRMYLVFLMRKPLQHAVQLLERLNSDLNQGQSSWQRRQSHKSSRACLFAGRP